MNKKILGSIVALVIAIVGYLYASPYLVLNSIKTAAQNGESEKVSQYIDYPSVRQSFKDQMNAMMLKEVQKQENDGFAALGAMLASAMVDKMIDAVVTPEGMTLMLQGKDLKQSVSGGENESAEHKQEEHQPDYETSYTSFNDFQVVIKDPNKSKEVKVLMVRDGLSWKINKIVVPLDN